MKLRWTENEDADGCTLSEVESQLLIRLAGKLSERELNSKAFSPEEIKIIQNWYYAFCTPEEDE